MIVQAIAGAAIGILLGILVLKALDVEWAERWYEFRHRNDPPPTPLQLSMMDRVLKELYAPGLRVALEANVPISDMLRRRVITRRGTFKDPESLEHWHVKPGAIKGFDGINVIYDEMVPADTAYLIDPTTMYFENPHWTWDNAGSEPFDPDWEEWHDFGE